MAARTGPEHCDPRSPVWHGAFVVLFGASVLLMLLLNVAVPDVVPADDLHISMESMAAFRPVAPVAVHRTPASAALATTLGSTSLAARAVPAAARASSALWALADSKATLYDMPVSNMGARVRLVIYWKGLEDRIAIKSPADLGGLKSAGYLAISPQGKMPCLHLPDGTSLPESEVIAQFLIESFPEAGPQLSGVTPMERANIRLLTRFHDLYIGPVQGAMYKAMSAEERQTSLKAMHQQLKILEERAVGPFLTGPTPTSADAAIFPTFVFMNYILPLHFGWSAFDGCPKLQQWFNTMSKDPQGSRVRSEVEGGLKNWESSGRWESLGITEQVKSSGLRFSPPF